MNKLNYTIAKILVACLIAALSLNTANAAVLGKGASKPAQLTQSFVWYDGDHERQVWLNPQIVAEFNPGAQGESAIKSVHPAAWIMRTKRRQAAVRFWKLNDTAATVMNSLKSVHPQGKYSDVFQDGPSGNGRMRALPGNIIVYLNPQWNETKVNDWLATHKFEAVKKLEIGANIYVIKTGPGLEALNTANALYRSGEVKAAFPDWWKEAVAR